MEFRGDIGKGGWGIEDVWDKKSLCHGLEGRTTVEASILFPCNDYFFPPNRIPSARVMSIQIPHEKLPIIVCNCLPSRT